jgi:predicted GNAT family acetyltransferase
VLGWLDAFAAEALPHEGPDLDNADWLERRLVDPDGELLLWIDEGTPVSLAAAGGATPSGLRVGPVYTPPQRRGRGYASAVTAAVSAGALARGWEYCFLFTDLANPTSNRIYRRLGYEPVCDVDQWVFTTA